MTGYIFGGSTHETAQSLKRKRDLARGMVDRALSQDAHDLPSAISKVGTTLFGRMHYDKANKGIEAGRTEANQAALSEIGNYLQAGAQSPFVPQPTQETAASAFNPFIPTSNQPFNDALAQSESGGRYDIQNSEGYTGKYQFGQDRLDDFNRANGSNFTTAQLQQNPQLQEQVQDWHVADIDNFVTSNGLDQYIGQNIGGTTLSQDGLRAMAHLGGKAGMQKFLQTGGQYNPSDSNGTSLLDYAARFSSAPQNAINSQLQPQQFQQQGTPQQGSDINHMLELLANPYLNESYSNIMGALVQKRLQGPEQISAFDQARIAKLQAETQSIQNPQRKILKSADGRQRYQDTGELVFPDAGPAVRQITGDEAAALNLDPNKTYNLSGDGRVTPVGGAGVNVNVGAGESAFTKEAAKAQAKSFSDYSNQGIAANEDLAVFGELEQAMNNIGTGGFFTNLRGMAAGYGFDVDGKSDFDVVNTLIDRLTPRQRVPGTGATSDFEARMFRNSLPSLLKSPEGNTIILQTYKSLAENARERGRIADDALTGAITRDEALQQFRALPDPQERLKAYKAGKPYVDGPPIGTVEGGYRFKGGNAANKNNWEKVQ